MQTQTTTERPAVAVDSRKRKSATRQRTRENPIQRLARLRQEASDEIERLLAFLDLTDDFADEREEGADDLPCDGDERELDESDKEPSLGWREGMVQVIGHSYDDREAGVGPRTPQYRTEIDGPQVKVEVSYRRFVHGLTPAQREAWKKRQPRHSVYSSSNDVVLR